MRLVFAGTPEFAERALSALLRAGYDVVQVLTQPDRPSGRGMQPVPSAVKRLGLSEGLEVFQPESLRSSETLARLRALNADAMVVAAYGMILPQAMLDLAPGRALNIHASLLPRWRGAAPVQRAILAGDRATGVSIMHMEAGLDTGPLLAQRQVEIESDDDAGSLLRKLSSLGGEMIVAALRDLESGVARSVPQDPAGVTYASKIAKEETRLDWFRPALELERAVRAFRPAPGANTTLGAEVIKIWRTRVVPGHGKPGTLMESSNEFIVACGRDCLAIDELQKPGGKRMAAAQFLRGHPIDVGSRLGLPAP